MSFPPSSFTPPSLGPISQVTSPPTTAEIRSQAVARLKRAGSLPRTPENRRPSQNEQDVHNVQTTQEATAGPSTLTIHPIHYDTEEVLSPSPIASGFDHSALSPPNATSMQRSASSSSSYHMPTPPYLTYGQASGTPYYSNVSSGSATPDWSAVQLAQSYLPSLSPAGMPSSPFVSRTGTPVLGRNTPSPLPTLGELRTLQRSNSAAARAHAMNKLTGGKDTPSDEDHTIHGQSFRPDLHRAGSLGAPRVFGMAMIRAARTKPAEEPSPVETAVAESRPRLQRSFTVSSSNMGEERRSAVGRRMVERLAESKAARARDVMEEEVRRLWEQKRSASQDQDCQGMDEGDEEVEPATGFPVIEPASPVLPPSVQGKGGAGDDLLAPPDRSVSRDTMRSGEEAFEYEAHLRRSLSSRTARGAVGSSPEISSCNIQARNEDALEQLHDHQQNPHQQLHLERPLSFPRPAFATPTRGHVQQSSTSTNGTARDSSSPGNHSTTSRDALGSMMFIVGRGSTSHPSGNGRQGDANWPTEVEDSNGSDWGTPAKDLYQPMFNESPFARSPLGPIAQHIPSQLGLIQASADDDNLTPPGGSQRASIMSWEEVGGPVDQEVPSDSHYQKRSGSISAKIGRNIKTALRKRSQSRSSVTSSNRTSPPTSPIAAAIQNFSRRGSEASATPSQGSVARSFVRGSPVIQQGEHVQRQPSMGSLSPSVLGQPELSENSMLLQHQLSSVADPSMTAWLPRADINDPRIHSSKLSPFPGMAKLERRSADSTMLEAPHLVHQTSDSAVPSQQRVTAPNDLYALPLPPALSEDSRRESDDSVGKRSWLAKAFGQQTSPRSSGSASRSSSIPDLVDPTYGRRKPSADGHPSFLLPQSDSDPFAGPPLPSSKPSRQRSASPSVSIVPEVSEEGSRLTRFTVATQHMDNAPPVIEEEEEEAETGDSGETIPQKSMDVLNRMDDLLALASDDPARPDILDDPPRKLIMATQVLQVVNVNTAKDRFLFLFNDILVICKPIITSGVTATLDMTYLVKSIVSLDRLHISGFDPEPTGEPERHVVVQRFIERFAEDPIAACRYLVERSNPRVDAITLASLIFKTFELDKGKIGDLLAGNNKLMRAFVDRFHFVGMRVNDALRMFLLSLRFPEDTDTAENLLVGFARRYHEVNEEFLPYDVSMAIDFVMALMQLNDALYGMYGFAQATNNVTEEVFVNAWRATDSNAQVPEATLRETFASVRENPLRQALHPQTEQQQEVIVVLTPARLPAKITYKTWSDDIRISIPSPDPDFRIMLLGEGLEFDPAVVDFSYTTDAVFRVRGTSLGSKSILFYRVGKNAPRYASLGNTRTFSVERAFMVHTFQVAFMSHTASKRKYCFSVPDADSRSRWGTLLRRQVQATLTGKSAALDNPQQRIRRAAEGVALQVLRDAIIPPDENTSDRPQRTNRSGSVSLTYGAQQGRYEADLGPLQPGKPGVTGERMGGMMDIQTGKELVLLCRQNSLLPGLLEVLQAGVGAGGGDRGNEHDVAPTHTEVNGRYLKHELPRIESYRARVPGGRV